MFINMLRAILTALALTVFVPAQAESPENPAKTEIARVLAAATAAEIKGPKAVPLGDQAVLDIPESFAFIPQREAAALMRAMGNQVGEGFYGLVIGEKMSGFISVRFDNAGYVKDDDAKSWNASELLQNLKEGTEADNEERRQRGIPEFVVSGWVEKPAYDSATHRLVWAAELRDKTPTPAEGSEPGVNYNTYQLGREGYISMNLVTDMANVQAEKPVAQQLLAGLQFNKGKRYTDFNSSTDNVAAYGLAALVGGVAAQKLGLLALVGVFLAKFAKLIILVAAGGAVALGKIFSSRNPKA